MHDLGEDDAADGRHFAWLQDHGTARGNRRRYLADDLIERPVPGSNEAHDTDGFPDDAGAAALEGELQSLERFDGRLQMNLARPGLCLARELERRTHLIAHRVRDVVVARVVQFQNLAQMPQALLASGERKGRESRLRGRNGTIHVRGAAQRNLRIRAFRRRIDDLEGFRLEGLDPGSVDVEILVVVRHLFSPIGNLITRSAAPNPYQMPPRATVIASPFTPPAASLQRNAITCATSRGSSTRFCG